MSTDDMKLGHRIYYFVNPYDPDMVHSTEAYSAAEASIILGQKLRVTAVQLIDVTDYESN